jgi:hypothetical protein
MSSLFHSPIHFALVEKHYLQSNRRTMFGTQQVNAQVALALNYFSLLITIRFIAT